MLWVRVEWFRLVWGRKWKRPRWCGLSSHLSRRHVRLRNHGIIDHLDRLRRDYSQPGVWGIITDVLPLLLTGRTINGIGIDVSRQKK